MKRPGNYTGIHFTPVRTQWRLAELTAALNGFNPQIISTRQYKK